MRFFRAKTGKLTAILTFLTIGLLTSTIAAAQISVHLGLNATFGTDLRRYGIVLRVVGVEDNVQLGIRAGYFFTQKPIGPPVSGREWQINLAAGFGFGNEYVIRPTGFYLANRTGRQVFLGYSLNLYFDTYQTSQRTGTLFLQYGKFGFYTENDLFAVHTDLFRTGAVRFAWLDSIVLSLNAVVWTPESKGVTVQYDSLYPARWGYKDLTKQPYGKFSTGLLYVQADWNGYSAGIGYESEWIRYVLQNKLIHDMIFLPKKWSVPANKHYPMVSDKGDAFLFKPGQKVRPGHPVLFIARHRGLFY